MDPSPVGRKCRGEVLGANDLSRPLARLLWSRHSPETPDTPYGVCLLRDRNETTGPLHPDREWEYFRVGTGPLGDT